MRRVVSIPAPDAPPRVFECKGRGHPPPPTVYIMAISARAKWPMPTCPSRTAPRRRAPSCCPTNEAAGGHGLGDAFGYTAPLRASFTEETRLECVAGVTVALARGCGRRPMAGRSGGWASAAIMAAWSWIGAGGQLGNLPGPCRLGVQFAISALAPDSAQAKAMGPKVFNSPMRLFAP